MLAVHSLADKEVSGTMWKYLNRNKITARRKDYGEGHLRPLYVTRLQAGSLLGNSLIPAVFCQPHCLQWACFPKRNTRMSIWLAAGSTNRGLPAMGPGAGNPMVSEEHHELCKSTKEDSSLKPEHLGICTAETQGIASKPGSATEYQTPQFRHHSLRGADPHSKH